MATIAVIRHRVRDFDAWRKVYDEAHDLRQAHHVRHHAVWRAQHDPHLVTVVHVFDSPDVARAFLDTPTLAAAMTRAGVELPTLRAELFEEIEAGSLEHASR